SIFIQELLVNRRDLSASTVEVQNHVFDFGHMSKQTILNPRNPLCLWNLVGKNSNLQLRRSQYPGRKEDHARNLGRENQGYSATSAPPIRLAPRANACTRRRAVPQTLVGLCQYRCIHDARTAGPDR